MDPFGSPGSKRWITVKVLFLLSRPDQLPVLHRSGAHGGGHLPRQQGHLPVQRQGDYENMIKLNILYQILWGLFGLHG